MRSVIASTEPNAQQEPQFAWSRTSLSDGQLAPRGAVRQSNESGSATLGRALCGSRSSELRVCRAPGDDQHRTIARRERVFWHSKQVHLACPVWLLAVAGQGVCEGWRERGIPFSFITSAIVACSKRSLRPA